MFCEREIGGFELTILGDGSTPDDLVKDIIERKGTHWADGPVLVNLLDEIVIKHEQWNKLLPRIQPYFAVKCEKHPVILRLLAYLGLNFDCASLDEIRKILDFGAGPDRIINANPHKTDTCIVQMRKNGVDLMTVDSVEEMKKIVRIHPKARMLLRLFFFNGGGVAESFGTKYGCHVDEARVFLEQARDIGANIVGTCFMPGLTPDPTVYARAARMSKTVFDLASSMGFNFNVLDVGGNWPGDDDELFGKMSANLNAVLDECFPVSSGVRIMAEPGRYFVMSSGTVYANVIGKRDKESMAAIHAQLAEKDSRNEINEHTNNHMTNAAFTYVISDSVFKHFRFESSEVDPVIKSEMLFRHREPDTHYPSFLYGFSCAGFDIIQGNAYLPEMQLGDWLVIRDKGNYSRSLRCDFQDLPEPIDLFTVTGKYWDIVSKAITMGQQR